MANGFGPDAPRNPFDPFDDVRDPFRDERRRARLRERAREARFRESVRRRTRASDAARRAAAETAAKTAKSRVFGAIARAGRVLNPGGAIIAAAGVIADAVAEIQRQEIDAEVEAANERLQRKITARAKEAVLRTTGMRADEQRPSVPGELAGGSALEGVRLPERGTAAEPEPVIRPGGSVTPDFSGRPGTIITEQPIPGTPTPGTVRPPVIDAPPKAPPSDAPFELPELATPGFGQPEVFRAPQTDPRFIANPVQFPVFRPIGDVLPRASAPRLPDNLTRFQDDPLQFPQPNPQPDPARQRCKPCKEDNPKPRDRCFKGLYREGRLDTEVDFTEWAEINCETGVEI